MTVAKMTARHRHIRRGAGSVILDIIIYAVMILVLLACLVPFIYMLALSFSDSKAIVNNEVTFWPVGFNLGSYEQIFTYPNFFRAYGNTFFYTIAGTAISLLMTMLFAYPLSKGYLRGQTFFTKMVIVSMFFSGGMIPNFLLISNLQLTGTVWAMLLPFAINQFNLIILVNFFKALPAEIEEAALTGESVPVNKVVSALGLDDGKDVPLGDRKNMAYMGSTVVYGRGRVLITGWPRWACIRRCFSGTTGSTPFSTSTPASTPSCSFCATSSTAPPCSAMPRASATNPPSLSPSRAPSS